MNNHVFLEVAGIGLEAALFPAAEEIKSRGIFSTLRGAVQGLTTLFTFKPTRFSVSFDGRRLRHLRALQISVCNSPYYGAHFQFAPNALMNDGLLDVLIYRNFSKLEYLLHAASIIQGQRILEAKVSRCKVKALRIYSEQPVETHIDGELQGQTPVTITIQAGALRVRVPEKVASGPNMRSKQAKQTRLNQQSQLPTALEQKGPLHVK